MQSKSSLFKCFSQGNQEDDAEERPAFLTQSEYCLIKAADANPERRAVSGPFLTLQRKQIRHPVTMPEMGKAIHLDDRYYGTAKCLLDRADDWAFNTFNLDVATGGRALSVLLIHFFRKYNFVETFELDATRVWSCFNLIEAGYHASNPYHNSVHAADVTQAMHCFLLEEKIREHLTPVEAMSALLAAVCHDLDHPGVNQPFLIATSNHLATLYKNFSVLENHHWRSAIACLRESGIFDALDRDLWEDIAYNIRSLILATDITRQQEFLSRFKRLLENDLLIMEARECRHFILQIGLKCADLCNPCRPWAISRRWSLQVCREFYRQGDYERKLKLPVTPMCDQQKMTVAKIQADFFKFVVTPLFGLWNRFLDTDTSRGLIVNLNDNHARWDSLVREQKPTGPSTDRTAERAPLAEEEDGDLDDDLSSLASLRPTDVGFDASDEGLAASWTRRHSMPLSQPKLLPRTTIRRQSFPHAAARLSAETAGSRTFGAFPLCHSPRLSLKTLSAEMLRPKSSILSLSDDAAVRLGRLEAEGDAESSTGQLADLTRSLKAEAVRNDEEKGDGRKEFCGSPSDGDGVGDSPARSTTERAETQESTSGCSDGCGCPSSVSEERLPPASSCDAKSDCESAVAPTGEEDDKDSRQPSASSERTRCYRAVISRTTSYLTVTDTSVVLPLPPRFAGRSHSIASPQSADAEATLRATEKLVRQMSDGNLRDGWNVGAVDEKAGGRGEPQTADSWCLHVGRGLSEERPSLPSRDFDLPAPSWRGSCVSVASSGSSRLTGRRGSAPVVLASDVVVEFQGGGLKGGSGSGTYVRRWSIPSEPTPDAEGDVDGGSGYGRRVFRKELVRRHSFGLLEPFPALPSSESENDGSSPAPTGTTCSSRRDSSAPHDVRGRQNFGTEDGSETEGSLGSRDAFFPCLSGPPRSARRRGSLPANFPPSVDRRGVSGGVRASATAAEGFPATEDGADGKPSAAAWGRRRGSAGEILGALLGTTAAYATLRALAASDLPPAARLPRRGSGGLELLSGFWRSRTAADAPALTGRLRLPRQALSLDSPACSEWFPVGTGTSPAGNCVLCRRRRGSFPLDLSLFSLSSGTASCGD